MTRLREIHWCVEAEDSKTISGVDWMHAVLIRFPSDSKSARVNASSFSRPSPPGKRLTQRHAQVCLFNHPRTTLLLMLLSCCLPHMLFGQGSPAVLTSPAPGSVLPGSSVTFSWTAGSGVTAYALHLGTTGWGSTDLYNPSSTSATSATVTGLPTNGVTVYATLYSLLNGVWQSAYYTYTASAGSAIAALTSPAPGSVLPGSSVTFSWTAGSGVTAYALHLGTGPLMKDLFDSGVISATSITVTGLPTNGATIYATVYSEINGVWLPNGYTYTAATLPAMAALSSPAPGSVLPGSSETFSWTAGTGVTAYALHLGTGPLMKDLFDSGVISTTSIAVTGLPTNGATIYATVYSEINGVWLPNGYTYTAATLPTAATLTSPAPGSVLPGSSVTFSWTKGTEVTAYALHLGITGPLTKDLFDSGVISTTSITVTGLPTNGATIYATVYSEINGVYIPVSSTYIEASSGGAKLGINATSVAFGNVAVNTAATQEVTLTSTGTMPLTISAAMLTGSGFTMPGATFPVTLNPGQAVALNVQFEPVATGAVTGQLTISSNSSTGGTSVISLSGTGANTSYQVDLTWGAPISSAVPVAGYNIYRAQTGGSYALLNASPETQTAYLDSTVQAGMTYDYVIKSVDGTGVASAPTNAIAVTIP
jgi:hypothetical protein